MNFSKKYLSDSELTIFLFINVSGFAWCSPAKACLYQRTPSCTRGLVFGLAFSNLPTSNVAFNFA